MVVQELGEGRQLKIRSALWDDKELATFSEAIGCVRQPLWESRSFQRSGNAVELIKTPRSFLKCLTEPLGFAT
jgi:hypothetical protein